MTITNKSSFPASAMIGKLCMLIPLTGKFGWHEIYPNNPRFTKPSKYSSFHRPWSSPPLTDDLLCVYQHPPSSDPFVLLDVWYDSYRDSYSYKILSPEGNVGWLVFDNREYKVVSVTPSPDISSQ